MGNISHLLFESLKIFYEFYSGFSIYHRNMVNSEANFVHRLLQGENQAYMELYDSYFKQLHRFAMNFVFDQELAKDIVQTVFITFYKNIASLEKDLNIGGYLTVMVRNSCLNHLRDRGVEDRHKTLYLQASEEAETLTWLDDEELIRKIRETVERLPEKYREICKLRFYHNMKYSEIASRLNISENAAKVQVHRAIQQIKSSLTRDDFQLIGLLLFYDIFLNTMNS